MCVGSNLFNQTKRHDLAYLDPALSFDSILAREILLECRVQGLVQAIYFFCLNINKFNLKKNLTLLIYIIQYVLEPIVTTKLNITHNFGKIV